jgi:UDP-N-acetylmuramate--alanine ligase
MTKEDLLQWMETDFNQRRDKEFGELLITAGAGDINQLVNPVKNILIH